MVLSQYLRKNNRVIIAASQTQQLVRSTSTSMTSRYFQIMRTTWTLCTTASEPERNQLWQQMDFFLFMRKLEETRATREKSQTARNKQEEWSKVGDPTTPHPHPPTPHPDIPPSLVGAFTHLNQYHFLHLYSYYQHCFPSVAVFSTVTGVYVVHL